ncbi:hypothetical protein Bca4012_090530 [Brassica carinata]|uniref:Jacalin-type lectin domain-containing protein n=2 Tax=Brassica TaxID=3705 RepID=A0A0D3AD06_BRAOL|nr:PREDICTED: nitrile-specifier protein 2-like [Brassica oleracea var. oleracea]
MEHLLKSRGNRFNDGVFRGLSGVYVGDDGVNVTFLKLVYEHTSGETIEVMHGVEIGNVEEFEFSYPEEYVTSLEWTCGVHLTLRRLIFRTSNGRTSRAFGNDQGVFPEIPVLVESNRDEAPAVVGFRGRYDHHGIIELKAYFGPPPPKKLREIGGLGGEEWDDGKHEHVKTIHIGRGASGLTMLQVDYKDGTTLVQGDRHGMVTLSEDTFEIPYETDHLVTVEVYRNKVGREDECISALRFKTRNGLVSEMYGVASGEMHSLTGHKIVGFFGRSGVKSLHSIGVRVSYPPIPEFQGEWVEVHQIGEIPVPRCSHAMAVVGKKIYSFGSELPSGQSGDNDMLVFDYGTFKWSRSPARGDVPELSLLGSGLVAIGSTLYVFGGQDGSGMHRRDFHSFDTTRSEWTQLPTNEIGPRSFHSMAAIGKKVFVFGGVSTTGLQKTLYVYETDSKVWSELPSPGYSFPEREGAGLHVVGGKLWVLYGFNGGMLDDVHTFDPDQQMWTQVETSGEKPCPRRGFASAVVTGNRILMFGGQSATEPDNVVGGTFCLNTETLKWEEIDMFNGWSGPTPRAWCASTSFSSAGGIDGMLVFGGKLQTSALCNGLFYYEVVGCSN